MLWSSSSTTAPLGTRSKIWHGRERASGPSARGTGAGRVRRARGWRRHRREPDGSRRSAIRRRSAGVRLLVLVALAVVVAIPAALSPVPADADTTFTVNKPGDGPDANLANAACDVNASQSGKQCTLRPATEESNDTPWADTINFNIGGTDPVKTNSPESSMPTITESVIINGYSQSG